MIKIIFMSEELNEFLKELVKKINKKFQEHRTRLAQIEAKLITMQREIDTIKEKVEKVSSGRIDKSIIDELE